MYYVDIGISKYNLEFFSSIAIQKFQPKNSMWKHDNDTCQCETNLASFTRFTYLSRLVNTNWFEALKKTFQT
jgi:hypothetical protein